MREWVLNWFSAKTGIGIEQLLAEKESNYLNLGYIDSFGFLELVSDCEKEKGIEFRDEDFGNPAFFSIAGFIKIAEENLGLL